MKVKKSKKKFIGTTLDDSLYLKRQSPTTIDPDKIQKALTALWGGKKPK